MLLKPSYGRSEKMAEEADDKLQKLAEAGVKVLGTNEQILPLFEHHCRNGTWFFIGAGVAALVVAFAPVGPWWTIVGALCIGYAINEWEARKIRARIRAQEGS